MELTIIIPIHKLNENDYTFLENCLLSLKNQSKKDFRTLILVSKEIDIENISKKYLNILQNLNYSIIEKDGNDTFYTDMVNYAVDNVATEYFSILEFDDVLQEYYVEEWYKWHNSDYNADHYLFFFVNVIKNKEYSGIQNTIAMAQNVMEERGYLDIDSVKQNNIVELTGGIFNKEKFVKIGKYKTNIKHYFNYELLLRMLHYGNKIFTIPKIGFLHQNFRNGSYSENFVENTKNGKINKSEWYNIALTEYLYSTERELVYGK